MPDTVVVDVHDWMTQAKCDGLRDVMFPDSEVRTAELARAKRVCQSCPVVARCLAEAVTRNEPHGVWGGLSTPERKAHTAGAPILTCTDCGLWYATRRSNGMCRACAEKARLRLVRMAGGDTRTVAA